MISVLIVDDHDLVRAGISRMLADDGSLSIVGEASSGEEAVDLARRLRPDVILMDLRMPGIGGLEATRKITRIDDQVKVVAVTACTDDPYPSRVMDAGAAAYITKSSQMDEMVKAIHLVNQGKRYISTDIAQTMALGNHEGSIFESLSEREMQIAIMIVECQKVQDISDKLCLSPKTVNSYRYRLFDKLGVSSDVELTLLAVRHGLLDVSNVD